MMSLEDNFLTEMIDKETMIGSHNHRDDPIKSKSYKTREGETFAKNGDPRSIRKYVAEVNVEIRSSGSGAVTHHAQ